MEKQNLSFSGGVQSGVTGGKSKLRALESMLGKSIRNHSMGAGVTWREWWSEQPYMASLPQIGAWSL